MQHTFMADWTGVSPLRFSSAKAPDSSLAKREVKKGKRDTWPAEQAQWSRLFPKWSVKLRIKVDSRPLVAISCKNSCIFVNFACFFYTPEITPFDCFYIIRCTFSRKQRKTINTKNVKDNVGNSKVPNFETKFRIFSN